MSDAEEDDMPPPMVVPDNLKPFASTKLLVAERASEDDLEDSDARPYPLQVIRQLIRTRSDRDDDDDSGSDSGGDDSDVEENTVINGLIIKKTLGKGAFSTVILGQKEADAGEFRALKKMSKMFLKRQRTFKTTPGSSHPVMVTALDRVHSEIDMQRSVWHPNVCALLGVIDDPDQDRLYLVLEYGNGGALMEWDEPTAEYYSNVFSKSPAGGLPEPVIRKVLSDAAQGLSHLHDMRILHRDIKPDNLLLFVEGVQAKKTCCFSQRTSKLKNPKPQNCSVKLCDLGVAHHYPKDGSSTVTDTAGTYHFFSPQASSGQPYEGCATDVWALGVTAFALATGKMPWFDTEWTTQDLFTALMERPLVFPADRTPSKQLVDLIGKMLVKDVKARATLADVLSHPFVRGPS